MWEYPWWKDPPGKDGILPGVVWAVTFFVLWLVGLHVAMAGIIAVAAMLVTSTVIILVARFRGED